MNFLDHLIPLALFCKQHSWPRKPQWHHWVYSKHPIAIKCVRRIGGRIMIDLKAFEEYVNNASLDEEN